MKNYIYKLILVFVFLLKSLFAFAFTYPEKPLDYVSDYSHVLSEENIHLLNKSLSALNQNYGPQVAIALFNTLDKEDIKDVSNTLFRNWKIGSKEKNDGILLLIDVQERKIRIEVGYGLEEIIPDVTANHIIHNKISPF